MIRCLCEANTRIFSNLIFKVVKEYYPEAILVIERNSYGQGVIDNLSDTEIERNLFYTNMTKSQIANKQRANKKGNYMYGIFNQSEIRETLYGLICTDIVSYKKRLIKSVDIFEELSTVVLHNGRYDHEVGSHDDLLIAFLFALYALLYDANMLKHFGIKRPAILSDNEYTMLEFEDSFRKRIRTKKDMINEVIGENKGYASLSDLQHLSNQTENLKRENELAGNPNKSIDLVEAYLDDLIRDSESTNYTVDGGQVKQNITQHDLGIDNPFKDMRKQQQNKPKSVNDMTSFLLGDDYSPY
jgi:hypothetical protein